jgi:hypothetical protein
MKTISRVEPFFISAKTELRMEPTVKASSDHRVLPPPPSSYAVKASRNN